MGGRVSRSSLIHRFRDWGLKPHPQASLWVLPESAWSPLVHRVYQAPDDSKLSSHLRQEELHRQDSGDPPPPAATIHSPEQVIFEEFLREHWDPGARLAPLASRCLNFLRSVGALAPDGEPGPGNPSQKPEPRRSLYPLKRPSVFSLEEAVFTESTESKAFYASPSGSEVVPPVFPANLVAASSSILVGAMPAHRHSLLALHRYFGVELVVTLTPCPLWDPRDSFWDLGHTDPRWASESAPTRTDADPDTELRATLPADRDRLKPGHWPRDPVSHLPRDILSLPPVCRTGDSGSGAASESKDAGVRYRRRLFNVNLGNGAESEFIDSQIPEALQAVRDFLSSHEHEHAHSPEDTHRQRQDQGRAPRFRLMHAPVADADVPTSEQMSAILEAAEETISGGGTVYVHCWQGSRRSWLVARSLVRALELEPAIVRFMSQLLGRTETAGQAAARDAAVLGAAEAASRSQLETDAQSLSSSIKRPCGGASGWSGSSGSTRPSAAEFVCQCDCEGCMEGCKGRYRRGLSPEASCERAPKGRLSDTAGAVQAYSTHLRSGLLKAAMSRVKGENTRSNRTADKYLLENAYFPAREPELFSVSRRPWMPGEDMRVEEPDDKRPRHADSTSFYPPVEPELRAGCADADVGPSPRQDDPNGDSMLFHLAASLAGAYSDSQSEFLASTTGTGAKTDAEVDSSSSWFRAARVEPMPCETPENTPHDPSEDDDSEDDDRKGEGARAVGGPEASESLTRIHDDQWLRFSRRVLLTACCGDYARAARLEQRVPLGLVARNPAQAKSLRRQWEDWFQQHRH